MIIRTPLLAAALCFFMLMVVLGFIPGQANRLASHINDKLLHTIAYGFIALLCFGAIVGHRLVRAAFCVVMVALLGLFDEYLQSLLPYRNASALDWCFDVGIALIISTALLGLMHMRETGWPFTVPANPD